MRRVVPFLALLAFACAKPDTPTSLDESRLSLNESASQEVPGNGPYKAASYINPDIGLPTFNPDVNPQSECETPDQEDTQQLSDAGATNRNVHNDACLFRRTTHGDDDFDGPATFESRGVGTISACPDPDGAGPKTATRVDVDGDGRFDRCLLSGYQTTGMDGDQEYHTRLNNDHTAGRQVVTFCYDPNRNGCADEHVSDRIVINWVAAGGDPHGPTRAASYINPDIGLPTFNPDVNPHSECETPDQTDRQTLSNPGATNNNVHNDACLFRPGTSRLVPFDGPATFESHGPVGEISACPDPDGAGPKTAQRVDSNNDGRFDRCLFSGYQTTGMDGDNEFHIRLNNSTTPGTQIVIFCYDPNRNGCADERVQDRITISWVAGSH